jgi:NADH-quinone oxidoreductase subunit F
MDLWISSAGATEAEQAAIETVLARAPASEDVVERQVAHGGLSRVAARRHLLLPTLQAVQRATGWVSEGALNEICRRLTVPPAEAYGVASFYALLSTSPRPPRVAHVCDDIVCGLAGAEELCTRLERLVGPADRSAADGTGTWQRSPCLGQCDRGPAVLFQLAGTVRDAVCAPATAEQIADVLAGGPPPEATAPAPPNRDTASAGLLARIGRCPPDDVAAYRSHGGFAALERAITLGPAGVIHEVIASKLQGRGGAAFPTGRKWEAVARAESRPHYVVCNADESEPGTYKDRVLLEGDPLALIEAMAIAGYAVGAEQGYLYVRGEYPVAMARLADAITAAEAAGALGDDVLGHGFRFRIEMRSGAGAYICGEETALFSSIEGFRGEPRSKPPFPTEVGLFGKPTVVNNVETLANIPAVVLAGGAAFAGMGTAHSTGPKLFSVSGAVKRPGVYEVPFGTTLRQLLALAGDLRDGHRLGSILLGGAAGSFIDPRHLDLPLTFEDTGAIGSSIGSGAVVVFDEATDMAPIVRRIAAFFRDESCGQCVPCRVGTVRQEELLARLARSAAATDAPSVALLGELAQVMRDASICGLGHTAATAVQSALALNLLEHHGPDPE